MKKEPVRLYRFTDGKLEQTTDGVLDAAENDKAQMEPRGVDLARRTAIKALRDDFSNFPADDYYAGEQTLATEAKDLSRARLTTTVRTVFTAAENTFGLKSKQYKQFGDPALTRLNDNDMVRNARNAMRIANKYLTPLAGEGITAAFLTDLEALIKALDDKIDDQKAAEREREIATGERVDKGNLLYTELVKVCNTGKDVWAEVNEAKYKQYVIYNTPSGEPEETGFGSLSVKITDGNGQPVEGAIVTILNTELTDETDADGDYAFESVKVGKQAMTVQAGGFVLYNDDAVEIFDSQDTINDIDLTPEEPEA